MTTNLLKLDFLDNRTSNFDRFVDSLLIDSTVKIILT